MTMAATKYAGLVLAPALWAINTQLGQILPYLDCNRQSSLSAAASIVCAMAATASALATLHFWEKSTSRSDLFISMIGWMAGFAFAFALFQQSAAALLIDACEQ